MLGALRRSPYWPVVSNPVLRLLLPGFALSYLGDGLALVAIVVLAQQLTPNPVLVGVAVAASSLPGAVGALALGRWLRRRPGAQLAGWDALLRATVFAAIAAAAASGDLGVGVYIVLLAVSSLLHAWGTAGRYTLMADILPPDNRLSGNAVITALSEAGTLAGPPLAGLIIVASGTPATAIALDAATFAALAATYGLALRRMRAAATPDRTPPPGPEVTARDRSGGFRILLADRRLLGLLTLSFVFFTAFGPVYVALPIKLDDPTTLGLYYTAFSAGALAGVAATGYLRRLSLTTVLIGTVLGFGAAMLPLGLGAPTALALPAFALAGAIWAPYTATSMAVLQNSTTNEHRTSVLAANSAVLIVAVPLGTAVGGVAVALVGAQHTLTGSALITLALGMIALASRLQTRS